MSVLNALARRLAPHLPLVCPAPAAAPRGPPLRRRPGLARALGLLALLPALAHGALPDGDEPPAAPDRLFEATVIEALGVIAPPPQRCLIEADLPTREPRPAPGPSRCSDNVGNREAPDYWIVDYQFRGNQYRVQLGSHPGNTIMVDRHGMPRG
jgi:hypothetical protein